MSRDFGKGLGALALFGILVGALAAWLWAGNISAAAQDDRDDLDLFLDASSAGWAEVTKQFFMVPEVAAENIGALSNEMDTSDEQVALLAETIRRRPSLDSAYIGYPNGEFLFVARSDELSPGGFRTRRIDIDTQGNRSVELTWTNAALEVLRSEDDPADTYDPRERPWYVPMLDNRSRHWTSPYVFDSSQEPGITHSLVVRRAGELEAVVGVDIRLSQVNEFLQELSPGENGIALVVDDNGRVLAESTMEVGTLAEQGDDGGLALYQSAELRELVEELGDSEFVRNRQPDGLRTTIVRRAGARDEWYLAVRALDADFLDTPTASNAFEVFAVGLTAAALAMALAYLVARYLLGLKNEAEIDELTGVYNRRAVRRELGALLARSKSPVYVAIVDLDEFKAINDERGHPAGDAALSEFAHRLVSFASANGLKAGRLGGDEFVLFGDGESPDWEVLNEHIARPIANDRGELRLTASIGIARSDLVPGATFETMMRAADHLLFEAKRSGGHSFRHTPGTNPLR